MSTVDCGLMSFICYVLKNLLYMLKNIYGFQIQHFEPVIRFHADIYEMRSSIFFYYYLGIGYASYNAALRTMVVRNEVFFSSY